MWEGLHSTYKIKDSVSTEGWHLRQVLKDEYNFHIVGELPGWYEDEPKQLWR